MDKILLKEILKPDVINKYETGYYGMEFTCKNCNYRFAQYIKRALLITEVTIICPHCECREKK